MDKINVRNLIRLNANKNVVDPTIVLGNKNYNKLGQLNTVADFTCHPQLKNADEISFTLYRYKDGYECNCWDDVVDFRSVYIKEFNEWFQITVETSDADVTTKKITGTELCASELSQTLLRNIEINTADDIARSDYVSPTVFYDEADTSTSLLNRLLDKNPNYTIKHVDYTLNNIQRQFSVDGTAVYDFLTGDLSTEIGCLFLFDSTDRSISAYDLYSNCLACDYRGEFDYVCPECGSTNVLAGYGEDTAIYVDKNNLSSDLDVKANADQVKNCFKVVGGDDEMTLAFQGINPNGSAYIYYFNDDTLSDMPDELAEKIISYNALYAEYEKTKVTTMNADLINAYNEIVDRIVALYPDKADKFQHLATSFTGFTNLRKGYYDTVDMTEYLTSGMMPTYVVPTTTASAQLALLTTANLSPVAVTNVSDISVYTANNAVLAMAKAIINTSIYKVDIVSSSLSSQTWNGKFIVTSISDDKDTATSTDNVTVQVNDDYTKYINQQIAKLMAKANDQGLTDLSKITSLDDFKTAVKKYGVNPLSSYESAYQTAIKVLAEDNVANAQSDLYADMYLPYYNRLVALQSEIQARSADIASVQRLQDSFTAQISTIQATLNFENYIGTDLWKVFVDYRREDTYTNSNYLGADLSNSDLVASAEQLMKVAKENARKSGEAEHTLTGTLHNFLTLTDKDGNLVFEPILDKFQLGNFIRVRVDRALYKLRLVDIQIDYNDLSKLSVTFDDISRVKTSSGCNAVDVVKKAIADAQSMYETYSYTQSQAIKGKEASGIIQNWVEKGLNATNVKIVNDDEVPDFVYDKHGLLARTYDEINAAYSDEQSRFYPKGLVITSDNWKTIDTAVGKFIYIDPITGEEKTGWGINAEKLIGKSIIGEQFGIYNSGGSMSFDRNGLAIKNADSTKVFTLTPNSPTDLITYTNNDTKELYLDNNGHLMLAGGLIVGNPSSGYYASITNDGKLICHNGTFSGELIAATGSFTGSLNVNNNFIVDSNGNCISHSLTSDNVSITGGNIGNWDINDIAIYKDYLDYRTYIQHPTSTNTWVFSTQEKYNGTYYGKWLVKQSGEMDLREYDTNGNLTNGMTFIGGSINAFDQATNTNMLLYTQGLVAKNSSNITTLQLVSNSANGTQDGLWITGSAGTEVTVLRDGINLWYRNGDGSVPKSTQIGKGFLAVSNNGTTYYTDCEFSVMGTTKMKDLYVYGTKNRIVNTKNYGELLLNAYETPSPMFGDIGEGILDENGECYIWLDDKFTEVVDKICRYNVFLTKYSQGDIYVSEREQNYFVIKGTPLMNFSWEIKATQKDYNNIRFDKPIEKTDIEKYIEEKEFLYSNIGLSFLEDYEKELENEKSN